MELVDGYHKRAYVYVGGLAILTTFDTGSFRSCDAIRLSFLEELEAKQKAGQLGAQTISPRISVAEMGITGASSTWKGSYDEVVNMRITFRSDGGHSATALITFVILKEATSPLLLGCPTLDKLMFAMTGDSIELRAYDLELPAVRPGKSSSAENMANLSESVTIRSEEMRELWVPTKADPSKE